MIHTALELVRRFTAWLHGIVIVVRSRQISVIGDWWPIWAFRCPKDTTMRLVFVASLQGGKKG